MRSHFAVRREIGEKAAKVQQAVDLLLRLLLLHGSTYERSAGRGGGAGDGGTNYLSFISPPVLS